MNIEYSERRPVFLHFLNSITKFVFIWQLIHRLLRHPVLTITFANNFTLFIFKSVMCCLHFKTFVLYSFHVGFLSSGTLKVSLSIFFFLLFFFYFSNALNHCLLAWKERNRNYFINELIISVKRNKTKTKP